jgi:hypothetical protein
MVNGGAAWNMSYAKDIVPEQFVEISMSLVDSDAVNSATIYQDYAMIHSRSTLSRVIKADTKTPDPEVYGSYVTLEENLWTLDGTKKIPVSTYESTDLGFVSANATVSQLMITLPEPTKKAIPGIVIVWSSEYNEYPTSFSVRFRHPDGAYYHPTVKDNHSSVSFVEVDIPFDQVVIAIDGTWNTPDHYHRIDRVVFGYSWTFDKSDIISYSHEQSADLLSAELPKNSIEFSLDNTDDKWNPYNPTGIAKYLSERQKVTVRYGVKTVNNVSTVWINAGTFYLSEWSAPANGLEARFVARDPVEFMLSTMYGSLGISSGTFGEIISSAVGLCEFPDGLETNVGAFLKNEKTSVPSDYLTPSESGVGQYGSVKYNVAEILQMCVNGMCAVCWFDRNGVLQIVDKPWEANADSVYEIPLDIAYAYPEITLNKPVKYVDVTYTPTDTSSGHILFDTDDCDNGVTQSIGIPMATNYTGMSRIYQYARAMFKKRTVVSGEFRADPRADVFDNVRVSTKYGDMDLILTRIKYTYNGSFRGEFTAQGMGEIVEAQEVE